MIKTADGLIKARKCIKRRDKPQMGSQGSSSIGGNRPEGETSHCRVKHTPASTINNQQEEIETNTADLFISFRLHPLTDSIKVYPSKSSTTTRKKGKQTNKQNRPKGFVFSSLLFRLFFGSFWGRPTPPASTSCTGGPLFCFDVMSGCFSRRVWTR